MPEKAELYNGGSAMQRGISNLKVCIICGFAPDQLVSQTREALEFADMGEWLFYDAKAKYQEEVRTNGLQGRQTRRDRLSSVEEALWKFLCVASVEGKNAIVDFSWVPETKHIFRQLESKLRRKGITLFWLQGIFHDDKSYQQEMRIVGASKDYRFCFAHHVQDGSVWAFRQEKDKDCLLYKKNSKGWEDNFFIIEGRNNGVRACVAFLKGKT